MITTLKSAFARWRLAILPSLSPALLKSLMPLLILAIGVTAMVMMYFWHDQSTYKPVFGGREKVAVTDMMGVLDTEHIPYRLHPDTGQVLVPESQLGKVRMLLASHGVTAQLPAGLELMDKNDPLGVSQFVQDVRFRRGLEGELTQSIMTLDAISSARVHLSIAKSTSFVSADGDKSSASVIVALKPGHTLSPEQIAAVINMVSGSVASLAPTRVSLVDQAGNLLSSHIDLADGFDATNNGDESQKRIQDGIRHNVRDLLGPTIGEDNFKVSVAAAVDNDQVQETLEKYGEAPKVTSEASREELDRSRASTMGVPGTLSNRAPAAPVPAPTPTTATAGAPGDPNAPKSDDGANKRNASSKQYAYDRSITQIKRSRGRLQKLSVAVVLNSAAAPSPKTGWSAAELAGIDKMLRSGLGIDADRGDNLSVSVLPFPAKAVPAQWWQERDNVIDFGTWATYAVGALLAFFLIIRPLLRLLTVYLTPPQLAGEAQLAHAGAAGAQNIIGHNAAAGAAAAAGAVPQLTGEPVAAAMPVVPLLENYDLPPAGSAVDVMVDHLKVLAGKEPERVAEVVKQWMQKNGRTQ